MLWIHFDSNLAVTSVFAKEFYLFGMDDAVTYSLHCKADLKTSMYAGLPERYGDEAAFLRNFD